MSRASRANDSKKMDNWLCLLASVIKQWLIDGAPAQEYDGVKPYIDLLKHYYPILYYSNEALLLAIEKSTV